MGALISYLKDLTSTLDPRVVNVLGGVAGVVILSLALSWGKSLSKKLSYSKLIKEKKLALEEERKENEEALTLNVDAKTSSAILRLSASQLAKALRDGKYTSETVVTVYSQAALRVHDKTNCLTAFLFKDALERARDADKKRASGAKDLPPLHGLPVSIKEHLWVEGTDSTMGLAQLCFKPNPEDGAIVKTLIAHGAIPYCKTNNSQLLLAYESSNPVYGTTSNPWGNDRTSGGSSGGEGALVGGGGSPLGVGTDIGGSVRAPADFSGIFGFKPTPQWLSLKGSTAPLEGFYSINPAAGPMSRHSEDLRLFMSVMTEGAPQNEHDVYVPPFGISASEEGKGKKKLRIGYYSDNGLMNASPAKARAVKEAKAALERAGHELVPFELPFDMRRVMTAYFGLMMGDGCEGLKLQLDGNSIDASIADMNQAVNMPNIVRNTIANILSLIGWKYNAGCLRAMKAKSVSELMVIQAEKDNLKAEFTKHWASANLDALLCTACAIPAPKHGESGKFVDIGANFILFNVLDWPAGVAPVTTVRDGEDVYESKVEGPILPFVKGTIKGSVGMPCGVQIVAPPWQDARVLTLLETLDKEIKFENTVCE